MAELQFPNVGNALLAGSSAAYQQGRSRREADAERRRQESQQYIEPALRGDQGAFGKLAANAPETAASIATMLGRMDGAQRAKAKDAAEYTAQAANAILQADPASRPGIYRQMREDGIRRGFNLDSLPPEYNPGLDGMLRSQRSMAIPILEQMKIEEHRPTPLGAAPSGGGGDGGGNYAGAISRVESGGRYDAVGPAANDKGNRAYGKYQIMDFNVGPWTQEILGKPMTPQEFVANPQAQDAVFNAKFGQYVTKYGSPGAAARAWFAGEGGMNNPGAKDVLGTSVAQYEQKFNAGLGSPAPATMPSVASNATVAQMPGAPQGLVPPAPQPAPMPSGGVPGPIAQGDTPQADGSGTPVAPGGVRVTPESQLSPEVRSVREIVRQVRPGFRVMITPKTGLPIYDSQGRLYVQGPNGEPDYLEIQKMPSAKQDDGGLFGNSLTGRALQVLRTTDPSSQEYAMAYGVLSKPQVFVDSTGERREIQPMDLGMFQPPAYGRGGQSAGTPAPVPAAPGAPSPAAPPVSTTAPLASGGTITTTPGTGQKATPAEMAKLREAEAEGNSIIAALADFKKEYKAAGFFDRAKSMTGANTGLNTSYNAAALLAKGEALFNLGVLNGPDLDIIRRTIPDPSTVKSGLVSPEDMEKSVAKIETLIKTRLAERKKSLGIQEPAAGGGDYPQQAVDRLKANPGERAMFDEIFGPGAAAKVLGR